MSWNFFGDHTPCTGREATSCLEKTMGWSRSTTLTLLRRLESKGAVASDTDHGKKSFRPLVKRDAAVLQETKHFLPRLWKLRLMVSSLTQKQALPQEEIDALYALLRELEKSMMLTWIISSSVCLQGSLSCGIF